MVKHVIIMKQIKSIWVGWLAAAGVVLSAAAMESRTDINPAMQYYQAFLVAPDLSPADKDYLFMNEWRGQKLPAKFGELITGYDNQFKLVRQAARSTVACDWGIDLTPGPATLLPQLARLKAIAQTSRLRVMWALQQGRPGDARDDLLAAFVLGRNCARDGTLISALVQIAIENIVCSVVAENFYQWPPQILKELEDGMSAAPPRVTMAACVPTEKAFGHDWLIARVKELQKENSGDDAKVMAAIRELMANLEESGEGHTSEAAKHWEQMTKESGGTSEGVLRVLQQLDSFYSKLGVVMALPQAEYEVQAKEFGTEIENSTNPVVSLLFPAFQKCRQKEFVILVKLAMVRAGIEYKLHGEDGLNNVIDPSGDAPFALERFLFEGVDRGFQLKSTYSPRGFPEVLIFVEKDGPGFLVDGMRAGQATAK
jgi:hypothetical protein